MNYKEMSDFEINLAVSDRYVWNLKDCEQVDCSKKEQKVFWADGEKWREFNPCSNPSDAMPILIESKIGFKWVNGGCTASSVMCGYHESTSDNPLRAAMIVFLMMQEKAQ